METRYRNVLNINKNKRCVTMINDLFICVMCLIVGVAVDVVAGISFLFQYIT